MDSTHLQFFKIWNEQITLTPKGYRLATLEEVRNHSDDIKRRPMQRLDEKEHMSDREHKMCLLDGYITYPSEGNFDIQETFGECQWRLLVKDSSDVRLSAGDVLRKELYRDITVSDQGKEIAFISAIRHGDTEVIYWVLTNTTLGEAQRLKDLMEDKKEILNNANIPYLKMLKTLVNLISSEFSLLPFEMDGCDTVADFALEYAARSLENQIENTIAVAELLIDIIDNKISDTDVSRWRKNKSAYKMSYVDKAAAKALREAKCIPMFTKLLSILPELLEDQVVKIQPLFGEVFMEAIIREYTIVERMLELKELIAEIKTGLFVQILGKAISKNRSDCAEKFLKVWSSEVGSESGELGGELDSDGKTLFHYAAQMGIVDVFKLVHDKRIVEKKDKFGRSILHLASLHGQTEFCKTCIEKWELKVDDTDSSGRNSLHFAVKGKGGLDLLDILISLSSSPIKLIHSKDYKGRTTLHLASAKGNIDIIQKLLSPPEIDARLVKQFIQETDFLGRTVLHVVSRRGHKEIVRLLLNNGSDPLKERDMDGKTALHYAAQAKDPTISLGICKLLLNKYEGSPDKKSLLLSASATGIGTADKGEGVHSTVEKFLVEKRKETEDQDLLRLAAINEDVEMVWELLDEGQGIESLFDKEWQKELRESQPTALRSVKTVIHQIEAMKGHGRDQPTMEDNLGKASC